MTTKKAAKRYVVVATSTRPWAVIAGEHVADLPDGRIELRDARMVVYYSPDAKGLYGVAQRGPGTGGRVSPAVERARVRGIEHEIECSPEARKAIEAEPWK